MTPKPRWKPGWQRRLAIVVVPLLLFGIWTLGGALFTTHQWNKAFESVNLSGDIPIYFDKDDNCTSGNENYICSYSNGSLHLLSKTVECFTDKNNLPTCKVLK